jgi:ribosome-binding factor A
LKKKHSQSHRKTSFGWASHNESSNPQDELIRRATSPKLDRKALQLCRQIEREISLILSGELDDDRVRDLLVLSVQPYPRTNLLLVTLQAAEIHTQAQLLELDGVLAAFKPAIRSEVAMAINRRKAPDLCFRVINPP